MGARHSGKNCYKAYLFSRSQGNVFTCCMDVGTFLSQLAELIV